MKTFVYLENHSRIPQFIVKKLQQRISVSKRVTWHKEFIDFRKRVSRNIKFKVASFQDKAKSSSGNRGATVKVKCLHCKSEFEARVADRKRGWGKFCSKSCKAKYQISSKQLKIKHK